MTTNDPRAALAEALGAVIEARMSRDLAWTQDDGKTIIRLDPEQAGWHIGHLVHGPLAERGVLLVDAKQYDTMLDLLRELSYGGVEHRMLDRYYVVQHDVRTWDETQAFVAALSDEVTE